MRFPYYPPPVPICGFNLNGVQEEDLEIRKADIKGCSGTCYVTDAENRFAGTVGTAQLIASEMDMPLRDNLSYSHHFIDGSLEISDAAAEAKDMFLEEIPILDNEGRLISVIKREQLIREKDSQYFTGSMFALAKNRMLWLLLLMFSAMITGKILGRYENAFAALPALVTFIPMLTDTGGNAGSQSSTIVIRRWRWEKSEQKIWERYCSRNSS